MEGQGLTLKCKAMGDPDPVIHWHFPDGKLVHNNSRTILYDNGTLEILITTLKDSGAFNCVASNAAGIANASVEVNMIPLPLFVNNTGHMKEADPGLSDITTSSKSNSNDTKNQDKRVVAVDLTSSSAVIRWPSERHIPGIRMYQIQYNSTSDDTLVYRMIPSTSKTFLVNDLAAGREYDLCVLAVYDDGITSLTATRVVGCVQFNTASESSQCRFIHSQFLGGTMIIIIGGIIVASVLVFIIILMIRYKAYSAPDDGKTKVSDVHSQTNGSQAAGLRRSASRPQGGDVHREESKQCKALVLKVDCEAREGPPATTAILEVELPPLPPGRGQGRPARQPGHPAPGPLPPRTRPRTAAWPAPPCPCASSGPAPAPRRPPGSRTKRGRWRTLGCCPTSWQELGTGSPSTGTTRSSRATATRGGRGGTGPPPSWTWTPLRWPTAR
ncbi:hypothetical protein ANANG_G00231350 [Anguilla anguilla]|uniref:Ig-like domain-containing protein n=1 Tax=Anguilla anguilla TaxID=7936 RepID=A0A9D3LTE9_ANGAN|nr:hypothetical protein ANANG_G00231350 [Anguilla anguilla]